MLRRMAAASLLCLAPSAAQESRFLRIPTTQTCGSVSQSLSHTLDGVFQLKSREVRPAEPHRPLLIVRGVLSQRPHRALTHRGIIIQALLRLRFTRRPVDRDLRALEGAGYGFVILCPVLGNRDGLDV